MFGMDWLSGPLLGAGLGAIAGGSSGGGGSSQSTQLDPRMANYVYGSDGQSGLLGDAQSIYKQQMAQGGLNDMQRQGMDMQRQYLMSPQYQQGFGNMAQGVPVIFSPFQQLRSIHAPRFHEM